MIVSIFLLICHFASGVPCIRVFEYGSLPKIFSSSSSRSGPAGHAGRCAGGCGCGALEPFGQRIARFFEVCSLPCWVRPLVGVGLMPWGNRVAPITQSSSLELLRINAMGYGRPLPEGWKTWVPFRVRCTCLAPAL